MINLNFELRNPWSIDPWNILWTRSRLIGKYKAIEFNGYRSSHVISVDFNLKPQGDHAGARIMFGVLGYNVELHFYDTRHHYWESHNEH